MPRRYFGTDGIRGRVGRPPITAEFVLRLGWAAGRVLSRGDGTGRVLIGKDTRISGYMFESALEAGLSAAGVDIRLLGPMPTPAIAYLTRTLHADAGILHADAGIVISASHNPYYDNGIKFFSAEGTKLPDAVEEAIEAELERPFETVDAVGLGKAERVEDAPGRYIEFCKSTLSEVRSLQGLEIVVDCAHGATYHVAPAVFDELGARVHAIGVEPDGLNINAGCGSTQPQALQAAVRERGADLGIAFDGDGDRVLMVDGRGELVDGDELLWILARGWLRRGRLRGPVVGTLMTNYGLERALAGMGIGLERAAVGDRYVLERMRAREAVLGGETSGHLICLDRVTTGDGIVSALQVLEELVLAGTDLHTLKGGMEKLPQHLVNVPLETGDRTVVEADPVREAVREAEAVLAGRGRVLLRPSGTEPVVRVMVEGPDPAEVEALARQVAEVVARAASA